MQIQWSFINIRCGLKCFKTTIVIYSPTLVLKDDSLNKELLKEIINLNTRQSNRDLVQKLNLIYSTLHKYLKQIKKTNKMLIS